MCLKSRGTCAYKSDPPENNTNMVSATGQSGPDEDRLLKGVEIPNRNAMQLLAPMMRPDRSQCLRLNAGYPTARQAARMVRSHGTGPNGMVASTAIRAINVPYPRQPDNFGFLSSSLMSSKAVATCHTKYTIKVDATINP